MPIYNWLIVVCWATFIVVWIIYAPSSKKIVRRTKAWWRYGLTLLLVAAIIVYSNDTAFPAYPAYFIPENPTVGTLAVILCAAGIAFAIWARVHLGSNWSPTPSVQEDHELVTSGPYRYVRHPIYTGMTFALIGAALISGTVWFVFCMGMIVMFVWRIHIEERFMTETFPDQYPEYKEQTKALIPFVW